MRCAENSRWLRARQAETRRRRYRWWYVVVVVYDDRVTVHLDGTHRISGRFWPDQRGRFNGAWEGRAACSWAGLSLSPLRLCPWR